MNLDGAKDRAGPLLRHSDRILDRDSRTLATLMLDTHATERGCSISERE